MRLIDGDTLKEELEYYIAKVGCSDPHNEALKWCIKFIDNKPTIEPEMHVPEIIGCKECKHFHYYAVCSTGCTGP